VPSTPGGTPCRLRRTEAGMSAIGWMELGGGVSVFRMGQMALVKVETGAIAEKADVFLLPARELDARPTPDPMDRMEGLVRETLARIKAE